MKTTIVLAGAIIATAAWVVCSRQTCTVVGVEDGDTFYAMCGGRPETVRLYCVDAPETEQGDWGVKATEALSRLLKKGDTVSLNVHGHSYDRIVADVITAASLDVGASLVSSGHAALDPRFCDDTGYIKVENRARQSAIGIWSEPGLQQRPWRYRRER